MSSVSLQDQLCEVKVQHAYKFQPVEGSAAEATA